MARLPTIRVGCAGWSIPGRYAERFAEGGTHLERYARCFPAVEINSSFYRPHKPATYARWAAAVPDDFRFSVKIPKEITHTRRLKDCIAPLERFLSETEGLGNKRGVLLVQLPPGLGFDPEMVHDFFRDFRERFEGDIVCEPRNAEWFESAAEALLTEFWIGRVAADPAIVPTAAKPAGWGGIEYYRLHGSPRVYYSEYSNADLERLAAALRSSRAAEAWCVFDNTASGAAALNAFDLEARLIGTRSA